MPLDDVRAPLDPRTRQPALGTLPTRARLDELVTRVLAPNASMMTLDGTNSYLIAAGEQAALVDPGPLDDEHFSHISQAIDELGVECRWVLVTHHHLDHSAAARPWARRLDAQVAAASVEVTGPDGRVLAPGERVRVGDTTVDVVPTPGHCADHLAFRLESGAMLVGDHILGRGSSVVTYPDGDLLDYLDSLRRVLDLGPSALYPGHGPAMTDDPMAVVRYYLAHRAYREQQILAVLAEGPAGPGELVRRIYADTAPALWPYAEQSTRTALDKLQAEDVLVRDSSGVASLR